MNVTDNTPPVITLLKNPDYYTIPGNPYEEEGFTATDNFDGDLTSRVCVSEQDGKVYYTVSDASGNTTVVERSIVYFDPIAPVITLNGSETVTLDFGAVYEEEGFTATDNCDGDITSRVTVTQTEEEILYSVRDSYDNETVVVRRLLYADLSAPEITLIGDADMTLYLGDDYIEEGCTAIDFVDGDLSSKVSITSDVDTNTVGEYRVVYRVSDTAGNAAELTRNVRVRAYNIPALEAEGKVVYLTFDDGPSSYTTGLLDVLDRYGAKATFFVTCQYKNTAPILKDIYERGHSIGVHTMSHDYAKIYKSTDAFLEDLYGMQDYIYEATGYRTYLSRFPGGSSNAVSKKYCEGIMTELVRIVREEGFQYFDWNVSSGDAEPSSKNMTPHQVATNVINGIKNRKVSVVLQHDIKKFSVDAVEEILIWGQENGYKFLPLSTESFAAHHGLNN